MRGLMTETEKTKPGLNVLLEASDSVRPGLDAKFKIPKLLHRMCAEHA